MTKKTYKKSTICYYANQNDPDASLKNGSFVRWSKRYGYSHFMLGDFQGFLNDLPKGMILIAREYAEELIPKCCK